MLVETDLLDFLGVIHKDDITAGCFETCAETAGLILLQELGQNLGGEGFQEFILNVVDETGKRCLLGPGFLDSSEMSTAAAIRR